MAILRKPVWLNNVVFYNTFVNPFVSCNPSSPYGFQFSPYDPSYLPIWHVLFSNTFRVCPSGTFTSIKFHQKIENTTPPVTLSTSKIIAFQGKISLSDTFTSISFSAFRKLLRHRLTFHGSPYYTCTPYYTCSFVTIFLQLLPETISSHTYSVAPPSSATSPPPDGGTTKPGS